MLKKYFLFVVSALVFLAGVIVLAAWCSSYPDFNLREQLKIISPLFLEINFLLLVIAGCITIGQGLYTGTVQRFLGGIGKRTWIALAAILVTGLTLIVFAVPREHRIFYDEDIYINIGQNIAMTKGQDARMERGVLDTIGTMGRRIIGQTGMCNDGKSEYGEYSCLRLEYNKEPNGWPYLLSIPFRIFGMSETAAFVTTNVLFLLATTALFFIGLLLFRSRDSGLYAALVFMLTPQVLIWCGTVAVEPSTACMAAFAVLSVLVYMRLRTDASLMLFVFMLVFAVQFRPESAMIAGVAGLTILCLHSEELKNGKFWLAMAICFCLLIPHLTHLYSVKDFNWGGTGPKFSWSYFWGGNFMVNSLFYFMNMRFPLIFTILFFLGLYMKSPGSGSRQLREKAPIILWFLLFWGIFCFFYAGSYNYGADVRFSVLSAAPIALLAGHGAACLAGWLRSRAGRVAAYAPLAIIILNMVSFGPYIRAITQEAWAARADHRYAMEMAKLLPEDSVVLTHNPNMFLAWGHNAAQASLATEQKSSFGDFFSRYKGGVYFHFNFWCNVDDPLQRSFCTNLLSWYDSTPVVQYQEKNYKYVLYKIEKKASPQSAQ